MVRETDIQLLEASGKNGRPGLGLARRRHELTADEKKVLDRLVADRVGYVEHPFFTSLLKKARDWKSQLAMDSQQMPSGVDSSLAGEMAPFSHLLSREEERQLFLRMNYARFRLSKETMQVRRKNLAVGLAKSILHWHRVESEARACLVRSNLPLVLSMARRIRIHGVEFGDLVSEGNMALLRAVDGFDCSRGFKFSTYACRAILKSFARLAAKSNKYRSRFPAEFDPAYEKSDWSDTQRQEAAKYCTEQLVRILQNNIAFLTPVELEVIKGRFAFGSEKERKTLVEMGEKLGLTKERVRQIQKKAVSKLRIALEEKLVGS